LKTAPSAVAVAAVLRRSPAVYAAADDSAQQHRSFSPEDRAAFLDARTAAPKAASN
jgi:hypothetical protein